MELWCSFFSSCSDRTIHKDGSFKCLLQANPMYIENIVQGPEHCLEVLLSLGLSTHNCDWSGSIFLLYRMLMLITQRIVLEKGDLIYLLTQHAIHYQMFNLDQGKVASISFSLLRFSKFHQWFDALCLLLNVYNRIWTGGALLYSFVL